MHSSHCEDLCKVAMETEKITFLSDIAAASAKKNEEKTHQHQSSNQALAVLL